jgi:hypothetical protein
LSQNESALMVPELNAARPPTLVLPATAPVAKDWVMPPKLAAIAAAAAHLPSAGGFPALQQLFRHKRREQHEAKACE